MTNPLTMSRKNKVEILKDCLIDIIDLLLMKYNQRDRVHMKYFKELSKSVKVVKDRVK